MIKRYFARFVSIAILVVCMLPFASGQNLALNRVFRSVWFATVANIDWHSKQSLSTNQQKAELIAILVTHQRAGINAIMFQIRPAADALYAQSREPWSRFITGI